jgi:hypothetical protein
MKIYVDFSVLTVGGDAIGRVSGLLDFPTVPPVGATVALSPTAGGKAPPAETGFTGHLKVVGVVFHPSTEEGSIAVSLADAVANSRESAQSLMRYFRDGFRLSADEY